MKKLCKGFKMENVLLTDSAMPEFSKVDISKAKEAVDFRLKKCLDLKEVLLQENQFTWAQFIYPLEEADDRLSKTFGLIAHLNAVQNTQELRDIYQYCVEKVSEYSTQTAQDERLLKAYQYILKNDTSLDRAQIKAIHDVIRDFKLSGVELEGQKRKEFEVIATKLSILQSQFENNVLDATMAWHYVTADQNELLGLSEDMLEQAWLRAESVGEKGYFLGLDAPTYLAVMQQADNRALRQKMYHAYVTRASSLAENPIYDNAKIMQEIIELRYKEAKLLGFNNYAELSLKSKMASSVDKVMAFLEDLLQRAKHQAQKELQALQSFANKHGLSGKLQVWDVPYYSEKMKKTLYDFTAEELRPYFPLPYVIQGLFKIIESLYGVHAQEVKEWDRYHLQTALYVFYDQKKDIRGKILVDLFARDNKRDGAWMDDCRTRYKRQDQSVQVPVAYVTCNFMPPKNNEDALLTHNDVLTLFHEFGHALHHILTKVDYLPVSGINGVEWDAVELPSQFMENFCWSREGLSLIAKHVKTGESLPTALFKKLEASRQYQSALAMLRQLEFALFDMKLHQVQPDGLDIHGTLLSIRKETSLFEVPEYNRFENSFSHIFAGGYAAGYYSYKWAEVLSSDAFSVFESSAEIINPKIGQSFLQNILEMGGSRPAAELFEAFRGQQPTVDALLKYNGIL